MARLSLENFPQPKTSLTDGQKFLIIALTIGLALLIWRLITEAYKARRIAQAKMVESDEKLKAAELERVAAQMVITKAFGQETTNLFNQATNTVVEDIKNQPKTDDGSTPQ
jgi:hypothetical protein